MFSFPRWLIHILLLRTYLLLIYNCKIQASLLDFNNLNQGQKSLYCAVLSNIFENELLHKLEGKFHYILRNLLQVNFFYKNKDQNLTWI